MKGEDIIRRNIVRLFKSRKGHLNYRIKRDYIRNGIATIPCRISDYSDVISTYSVKDYETLNPDFIDYLKEVADLTPAESPLVLNIIGDCLSQEEKNIIEDVILDDLAYGLGIAERELHRHTKIFLLMFLGLAISGVLLWFTQPLEDVPRELFFIPFWFMGETLCDYIFLTGHDLRRDKMLAGRLASIKVIFSDTYEDSDFTESDVEKLYSEIEKDVHKTIQEEK